MCVLEFTTRFKDKPVAVYTHSHTLSYMGHLFLIDEYDLATVRQLLASDPASASRARAVILLGSEWENWIAHVHLLVAWPGRHEHFLLRAHWPSDSSQSWKRVQKWMLAFRASNRAIEQ